MRAGAISPWIVRDSQSVVSVYPPIRESSTRSAIPGDTDARRKMLSVLLPPALAFAASGSRPGLSAPSRLVAPHMAANWLSIESAAGRASNLAIMDELKESGDATLWNTMRLAPRPVSLRELSQSTKIDEKALDPTAEEFSLEDIQDTLWHGPNPTRAPCGLCCECAAHTRATRALWQYQGDPRLLGGLHWVGCRQ